jgi:hypothetical protein
MTAMKTSFTGACPDLFKDSLTLCVAAQVERERTEGVMGGFRSHAASRCALPVIRIDDGSGEVDGLPGAVSRSAVFTVQTAERRLPAEKLEKGDGAPDR